MKWLLLLAFANPIMGCVTAQEEYDKEVDYYTGKSIKALVKDWGIPDKKMKLEDNEEIWIYSKDKGMSIVLMNGFGDATRNICVTQFTIENKIVSDWKWEGDCP